MEGSSEDQGVPQFLPPFANATNKEIFIELQKLESKKEGTESTLEEITDRINVVSEHLNNVKQELRLTESRVAAKHKEIETELHLQKLADREIGRIREEQGKLSDEKKSNDEKRNALQIQLYRTSEKLDQLKLVMNWNQDEMDQWIQAERQKEEDNLMLEKYERQDDSMMKDLNLRIEKVTISVLQKKDALDREITDTQAAQIQLDKTAEEFRNLHKERQDLLEKWDDAVDAMRKKDMSIETATEMLENRGIMLKQKQTELDSNAKFLEIEVSNNSELDVCIDNLTREMGKAREILGAEQRKALEASDAVDVVKNTLAKGANDLAQVSAENRIAKDNLDKLRKKLDDARKEFSATQRALDSEMNHLGSLELKDNELMAMHLSEERHLEESRKEVDHLKSVQFKQGQKLFEERHKERDLISNIASAHSQNKNLKSKIVQLEDQVQRQEEVMYNVEFQIILMERKVSRAKGERSDVETKELTQRIQKFTSELETVNSEHAQLLSQLKKAEDDLGHARRKNTKLSMDKGKIQSSIDQMYLETSMVQKAIKGIVEEKENSMVEHDVLKLQVKRLKDKLSLKADQVHALENKQAQLVLSLEERRRDIRNHRDSLQVELKNVREDIHRVTLELQERVIRGGKLKQKYEMLSTKGQSIFEDEPKSQAYFLIRAAQEREELQRYGDQLDTRIRIAEKEVHALEATLSQLVGVNSLLSKSMRKVSSVASASQRIELRDKLDAAYDKLKFKRTEEMNITADIHQAQTKLEKMKHDAQGAAMGLEELRKRKGEVEHQLQEQVAKQSRAKKKVAKLKLEILSKPTAQESIEGDIALAGHRESNRTVLGNLRALASERPELKLAERLESVGIKLPTSLSSSVHGSRSSSRLQSPSPGSSRSGMSAKGDSQASAASLTTIEVGKF